MIEKHNTDCMVCGAPLVYEQEPRQALCHYCGQQHKTSVRCAQGHLVCDTCHAKSGLDVIHHICSTTQEQDMLALLQLLHNHPRIPMHGPEHHAMVPAIIVTTYAQRGGQVNPMVLQTVIERGMKVPGGFCGFAGSCGAALGVGVAFAALLQSTPVQAVQRQQALQVTQQALQTLAQHQAARCCLRESWLALRCAAELSRTYLPVTLLAEAQWACNQWPKNKQCLGENCPVRRNRPPSIS